MGKLLEGLRSVRREETKKNVKRWGKSKNDKCRKTSPENLEMVVDGEGALKCI
jgi:hypothetical protein